MEADALMCVAAQHVCDVGGNVALLDQLPRRACQHDSINRRRPLLRVLTVLPRGRSVMGEESMRVAWSRDAPAWAYNPIRRPRAKSYACRCCQHSTAE